MNTALTHDDLVLGLASELENRTEITAVELAELYDLDEVETNELRAQLAELGVELVDDEESDLRLEETWVDH